jgi:hypothetical protein
MNDDKGDPPQGPFGVFARLNPPPHKVEEAVADYNARQDAEREKMARLRAARLARMAAEATSKPEAPKAKRKTKQP